MEYQARRVVPFWYHHVCRRRYCRGGVYFADARLGQVRGVNTAFAGTVLPITSRSWTATIVHIRRIVLGTRIILGIDMVGEEELWDLAR
jgi:hypothetical protein